MKLPTFCMVYKLEAFGRIEIPAENAEVAYQEFEKKEWADLLPYIQITRKNYINSFSKRKSYERKECRKKKKES